MRVCPARDDFLAEVVHAVVFCELVLANLFLQKIFLSMIPINQVRKKGVNLLRELGHFCFHVQISKTVLDVLDDLELCLQVKANELFQPREFPYWSYSC